MKLPKSINSKYIFPRFNRDGLFSIDPDTGIISLSGSLDRETAASHELVVRATDNGLFVCLFVCRLFFVCLFVCLSVVFCLFVCLFVRSFVCIYLLVICWLFVSLLLTYRLIRHC